MVRAKMSGKRSGKMSGKRSGKLPAKRLRGFTLIELLVVLAIIATLLSIVAPRYVHQSDRAKEAALKQNLSVMRRALDEYYSDTGRYRRHWAR